ncbi:MAG: hypothetical protein IJQ50_02440 [Clostridia bacterium]|nr:hypothetical protein [Clostridia bacterium]
MINAVFCIISFICGAAVYRFGFADGQRIKDGLKLKPIIKRKKERNDEEEKIKRGMANILNYANRKTKEMSTNE